MAASSGGLGRDSKGRPQSPIIGAANLSSLVSRSRLAQPHRVLRLRRHRHHRRDLRQLDPGAVSDARRATCGGRSSTSIDKADTVVGEINTIARGRRARGRSCSSRWSTTRCATCFTRDSCNGFVLDMFRTFVEPLEVEFGVKSNHRVGRFADVAKSQEYHERIEAINFSLAHDDGQSSRDLEQRRRHPGGRQPQRQDADVAVPGDAARHQGRQLPADPRRLRARPAAERRWRRTSASASA